MTDARLKTWTYTYDYNRGAVLTLVTDPLNNKTNYDYDANAFRKDEFINRNSDNALLYKISNEYDLVGNRKKTMETADGVQRQMTMTYDDLDRMLTMVDTANATTTYSYDENGNRISVTDALNRQWISTYDKKNRLESMRDPLPQPRVGRWQYDTADQLVAAFSPSGRVMRYTYDERGQQKTITDGLGSLMTLNYDNRGKLIGLTDQRGNKMSFEYDELFRVIGQRDPLGRLTTFEYDQVGNMRAKVDRLGRRTVIDYDVLNRPQQIRYADTTIDYTYDDAGRWKSINEASSTITWEYDEVSRLKKEITGLGVIEYDYNTANQRKLMKAADRSPVTYGYDSAGRLLTIAQGTETFTYGYDTLSRRTSLQRPNGVTTNYEYDEVHRLKRLKHTNASSMVLEDFQYDYNQDDEIKSILSLASAPLVPQSKTVSPADAANRIIQFGLASLSFDAEGQTITKTDPSGMSSYQWDATGRLKQVTLPGGHVVSYGYDPVGRRTSRTANGNTVTFQYDGGDIVIDQLSDGNAIDYLNGLNLDDKLRQTGGIYGTLYYLQDHLGSSIALASTGGVAVESQSYDAFGLNDGITRTRYAFTGREQDELTGIMYYRARWYDPASGRFATEDPIGLFGGLNYYSYVSNNPVIKTDPLGLLEMNCLQKWIAGGATVGGAVGAGVGGAAGAGVGAVGGAAAGGAAGSVVPVAGTAAGGAAGAVGGGFAGGALGAAKGGLAGGVIGGGAGALLGKLFCPPDTRAKDRCEPQSIPRPEAKRDWICVASCNIQNFSNIPNVPERVTGTGTGSSEEVACRNAKAAAVANAPRGTYARHCQCQCSQQ